MFAGTLLITIDTTTHDVYALLLMQQKVYGSWTLPKDATPAMRLLEDMRYDTVLWQNLSYDPDVQRTFTDYSTVVNYDDRESKDFMNTFSSCISWCLWDAYCSYRNRAIAIMRDHINLTPTRAEMAITFLALSERFHTYYNKLKERIEFQKMREIESLIRQGTGKSIFELREQVRIQEEKLQAAIEFTQYS